MSARAAHLEIIVSAARDAVRAALRRHMLLGESVAVGDKDGRVRILGPEDLKKILADE